MRGSPPRNRREGRLKSNGRAVPGRDVFADEDSYCAAPADIFCSRLKIPANADDPSDSDVLASGLACGELATGFFLTAVGFDAGCVLLAGSAVAGFDGGNGALAAA